MERNMVWDIPVRIFHWLLAASFIGAFVIANVADDESSVFAIHQLLGGVMVFMILLRIVWGFVGSRWARFSEFAARPSQLFEYIRGIVRGDDNRHTGHNPGSSVVAIAMFGLILGLGATGALMSSAEVFEELHEVLAWAMVAVVGVHLAGIVVHTIRHRENIALSMVDGKKQAPATGAISSARPVAGLLFMTLTGLWTVGLVNGYDARTRTVTLPLLGTSISIGEGDEHAEGVPRGEHGDFDDDDD